MKRKDRPTDEERRTMEGKEGRTYARTREEK